MSPYQYVLQKVFVTLKPSSYDGVGVFALKDIPNNSGTLIELTKGCHWIYTTPYYFVNSSLQEDHNFDKDTYLTVKNIKEGQEILSNYKRFEKNKTLI